MHSHSYQLHLPILPSSISSFLFFFICCCCFHSLDHELYYRKYFNAVFTFSRLLFSFPLSTHAIIIIIIIVEQQQQQQQQWVFIVLTGFEYNSKQERNVKRKMKQRIPTTGKESREKNPHRNKQLFQTKNEQLKMR